MVWLGYDLIIDTFIHVDHVFMPWKFQTTWRMFNRKEKFNFIKNMQTERLFVHPENTGAIVLSFDKAHYLIYNNTYCFIYCKITVKYTTNMYEAKQKKLLFELTLCTVVSIWNYFIDNKYYVLNICDYIYFALVVYINANYNTSLKKATVIIGNKNKQTLPYISTKPFWSDFKSKKLEINVQLSLSPKRDWLS